MTVPTDQVEYVPIAEAARELATTEPRVLMLLKQKALEGALQEGEWLVSRASLACYDKDRPAQAQQSHCSGCSVSRCGCN